MSTATTPAKGSDPKPKEAASRSCPASCGSAISGRDPHPVCITCMGAKHAQAALADRESCGYCSSMPEKILERRLRVAVAHPQDPLLAGTTDKPTAVTQQPRKTELWSDMLNDDDADMPPLFEDLLEVDPGDEGADGNDAASDFLEAVDMDDVEEDSTFPAAQSRPSSASEAATPVDSSLYDVCKRAAAKLNITWPAAVDAEDGERDLYDGKRLPPAHPPPKQLLPAFSACMREVGRFWNNPLRSKLPVQGYSKLEIHGMKELGLAEPPAVEPSVESYILHSATHEMGQQLDSGSPNPVLWEEICVVNDLILRSTRGAVQGCGHVMGLAVAGERGLWLNHSGLTDAQKAEVMDTAYDPTKGNDLLVQRSPRERAPLDRQAPGFPGRALGRRGGQPSTLASIPTSILASSNGQATPDHGENTPMLRLQQKNALLSPGRAKRSAIPSNQASSPVPPLKRRRMDPALRLCPKRHLHRRVKVDSQCVIALRPWREAHHALSAGVPLGAVSSRVTLTTDASLSGWGATLSGRTLYSSVEFGRRWQIVHERVAPNRFYWSKMGLDKEAGLIHLETSISEGRE
uniref:Uncharacterized protein n=1 Tax=Knipowitschia caucasica TaxID=637954 RepID=A0AAV2LK34_KNICA